MFELMEKTRNKKGFTLMEMLIVVAIIAILVAIIIPVFSTQLTKAKQATDAANIRSAYAMCQTCNLLETDPNGDAEAAATWYLQKDGKFSTTSGENNYKCQIAVSATDAKKVCPVASSGWAKDSTIAIKCTSGTWTVEL